MSDHMMDQAAEVQGDPHNELVIGAGTLHAPHATSEVVQEYTLPEPNPFTGLPGPGRFVLELRANGTVTWREVGQ